MNVTHTDIYESVQLSLKRHVIGGLISTVEARKLAGLIANDLEMRAAPVTGFMKYIRKDAEIG